MPTMNYSCLYLAELRSIQNRCNFATICARKGYRYVISFAHALFSSLKGRDFLLIVNFSSKLDSESDKV